MQRWKLCYNQAPNARRLVSKQVRTRGRHGSSHIKVIKILVIVSLERRGVIVMIKICEQWSKTRRTEDTFFPAPYDSSVIIQ